MKIILANKFYYPRGGDCIYTIELEKLLRRNGHDVAIFTQQFEENLDNDFSKYWPSEVDYSTKKVTNLLETLFRPIYSKEVKTKFQQLVSDFKPDVVHLNNIHSQISPIVAEISFKNNIPVVWTLHDYKLLCPSFSCLRDGKICELCFKKKGYVIKYKCVKNIIGSFIAFLEAKKWNKIKLEKFTSIFIAPSIFMKAKMIQGGFSVSSIRVINNFIDDNKIVENTIKKEKYYCYFGRFSHEKGVETLLKVASKLPYNLKLIGTGPLLVDLTNKYSKKNIEFLGFMQWEKLKEVIKKAQFIVIPSKCYENNPLTVIEAFALGTPVIGSNIGGIPEIIDKGKTGLIFEPGNEIDLINKIEYFFKKIDIYKCGENCIEYAKNHFRSSDYYNKIIKVYEYIIREYR